jgi:hypothetical protein
MWHAQQGDHFLTGELSRGAAGEHNQLKKTTGLERI